jgi:hypothetical protein
VAIAPEAIFNTGPVGAAATPPSTLPRRPPAQLVHPAQGAGPSAHRSGQPGRPPLPPAALLERVRRFAAATPAWAGLDGQPLVERTYELIDLDDDAEVWVIHWPSGGHLQLHDHGGSAGAFSVVSGSLEEHYLLRGKPFDVIGNRCHLPCAGAAFMGDYIHDVRNAGGRPATSVHAYSPPIPSMTYYQAGSHGLTAERTEYRVDARWLP